MSDGFLSSGKCRPGLTRLDLPLYFQLMNILLDILYHDIIPVFIVAGAGYVFGCLADPDIQSTNRLALYILNPCLIFSLIYKSQVGGHEFGQIAAFTVVTTLTMGGLSWLVARALRLSDAQTRAIMLPAMFVNSGNFGLAITQFAFGDEALARATVYLVVITIMVYTVGLYLAAGYGVTPQVALKKVFSIPPIYAVLAAGLVKLTQATLPEPVVRAVNLIGQASIPAFLLILGMQLARVAINRQWRLALLASTLRLVGGPLIGLGIAPLMGLDGLAYQASLLEASMPAAVVNTVLASEHNVEPQLVASIVLLSTLLSAASLTVVIAVIR